MSINAAQLEPGGLFDHLKTGADVMRTWKLTVLAAGALSALSLGLEFFIARAAGEGVGSFWVFLVAFVFLIIVFTLTAQESEGDDDSADHWR